LFFIIDVLGANGAGKTTTFRMLINDLKPTSGEIIIHGKNINMMVSVLN
jgi:ABC-type multidrug transport system ATPase subunit